MKDNFIKKLKKAGETLLPFAKPFAIKAGIGMILAMILALVGVMLVLGAFTVKPWILATLVIFAIAAVSVIVTMLLTLVPPALNKVLTTVYSFMIVGAIFSLLLYAIISSGFDLSDMNWQRIFSGFASDKLFYTVFIFFAIFSVAGYYGFVNRAEFSRFASI